MKTFVFGDCFEAMIAASRLRDEGYAVDIYDEAVASLWGPMAVGGVRVIVHGRDGVEVADENEEDERAEAAEGLLDRMLRRFAMSVLGLGGCLLVSSLLLVAFFNPAGVSLVVLGSILLVFWVSALAGIAETTKKMSRSPLGIGIGAALSVASILVFGIG